jgi:hypothetical protein
MWVNKHTAITIVSLVQFKDVDIVRGELPRVYLATPHEIGLRLKESRGGAGKTILKEKHSWKNGKSYRTY